MKFPTVKGKKDPIFERRQCRVCRKRGLGEPNSFATLGGGAMMPISKSTMVPAFDGVAWLEIGWHGAHSDMNGKGLLPDTGSHVRIVDDVPFGQFELYFCSTKCLRTFLNKAVDELEKRIK